MPKPTKAIAPKGPVTTPIPKAPGEGGPAQGVLPPDDVVAGLAAMLPVSTPDAATDDPVADALGRLENLRQKTQQALDNTDPANEAVCAKLRDILDAVFDARTKLNQQAIEDHTISLQAAGEQLDPGIDALKLLRDQLAAVAHTVKEFADVLKAADDAISGIRGVLASFGA